MHGMQVEGQTDCGYKSDDKHIFDDSEDTVDTQDGAFDIGYDLDVYEPGD